MKILLAVDGSKFTKKALAFLVTSDSLLSASNELHVLHVQPVLPPRVKTVAGRTLVDNYYAKEAESVLAPIRKFLDRHPVAYHADWVIGHPSEEIVKAAKRGKIHLIVMGTHGHGVLGRILMGSVAQRVVSECDVPVLLVK
jgi:nucleotide-binding universal stress UspA family protein